MSEALSRFYGSGPVEVYPNGSGPAALGWTATGATAARSGTVVAFTTPSHPDSFDPQAASQAIAEYTGHGSAYIDVKALSAGGRQADGRSAIEVANQQLGADHAIPSDDKSVQMLQNALEESKTSGAVSFMWKDTTDKLVCVTVDDQISDRSLQGMMSGAFEGEEPNGPSKVATPLLTKWARNHDYLGHCGDGQFAMWPLDSSLVPHARYEKEVRADAVAGFLQARDDGNTDTVRKIADYRASYSLNGADAGNRQITVGMLYATSPTLDAVAVEADRRLKLPPDDPANLKNMSLGAIMKLGDDVTKRTLLSKDDFDTLHTESRGLVVAATKATNERDSTITESQWLQNLNRVAGERNLSPVTRTWLARGEQGYTALYPVPTKQLDLQPVREAPAPALTIPKPDKPHGAVVALHGEPLEPPKKAEQAPATRPQVGPSLTDKAVSFLMGSVTDDAGNSTLKSSIAGLGDSNRLAELYAGTKVRRDALATTMAGTDDLERLHDQLEIGRRLLGEELAKRRPDFAKSAATDLVPLASPAGLALEAPKATLRIPDRRGYDR